MWIICCYVVKLNMHCGPLFSQCSRFNGIYQGVLLIYYLDEEIGSVNILPLFGIKSPYA